MAKTSQRRASTRRANYERRARLEALKREHREAERRRTLIFGLAGILVGAALIAAVVLPRTLGSGSHHPAKPVVTPSPALSTPALPQASPTAAPSLATSGPATTTKPAATASRTP